MVAWRDRTFLFYYFCCQGFQSLISPFWLFLTSFIKAFNSLSWKHWIVNQCRLLVNQFYRITEVWLTFMLFFLNIVCYSVLYVNQDTGKLGNQHTYYIWCVYCIPVMYFCHSITFYKEVEEQSKPFSITKCQIWPVSHLLSTWC